MEIEMLRANRPLKKKTKIEEVIISFRSEDVEHEWRIFKEPTKVKIETKYRELHRGGQDDFWNEWRRCQPTQTLYEFLPYKKDLLGDR